MRLTVVSGILLGLSLVPAPFGSVQAQEAKTAELEKRAAHLRRDAREPTERAVSRFVEQIRKHPLKPLTVSDRGRLYVIDVISGEAMPFADESDRGFTACGSPTWSTDGRQILFDAFPRGQTHLVHNGDRSGRGGPGSDGPRAWQLPHFFADRRPHRLPP